MHILLNYDTVKNKLRLFAICDKFNDYKMFLCTSITVTTIYIHVSTITWRDSQLDRIFDFVILFCEEPHNLDVILLRELK